VDGGLPFDGRVRIPPSAPTKVALYDKSQGEQLLTTNIQSAQMSQIRIMIIGVIALIIMIFIWGQARSIGAPPLFGVRHNLHGPLDRLPRCAVVDQGILGTATTGRLAIIVALWIWTGCSLYSWVRIPPTAPVIIATAYSGFSRLQTDGGRE